MFARKWPTVLGGVLMLGVVATVSTSALSNPKRTTYFTFDHAVQIPGATLAAGTYVFELADPDNARHVVRVLSKDRSIVYLLGFSVPVERPANGNMDARIVFGEPSGTNPLPINAWYPQDDRIGRQFIR